MKKHVGRPSNDELRSRKNKQILIIGVVAVSIFLIVLLFETGTLSNLMGNSVTDGNYKKIEEKAYEIGDVNKDGSINIMDVQSIGNYIVELEKYDDYQKILADVNKDGAVNTVDQTVLRKYISNYSSSSIGMQHHIGEKACLEGRPNNRGYCIRKIYIDSEILYGDVNSDGVVNIEDQTKLSRCIADVSGYSLNETEKKAADVNLDGEINIDDVTTLQKFFAGIITKLPYKG